MDVRPTTKSVKISSYMGISYFWARILNVGTHVHRCLLYYSVANIMQSILHHDFVEYVRIYMYNMLQIMSSVFKHFAPYTEFLKPRSHS